MFLTLLPLVVLLRTDTLQLKFIGNEAVVVSDGSLTLVTDYPYRPGAFGYMRYDPADHPLGQAAVLLITHRHADHFDPAAARDSTWRILAPRELAPRLGGARLLPLDSVVAIGPARIRPIATPHDGGRVEHYSYLVEWAGRRLYFVGDTEDPVALLAQRSLDVAFVTPWLWRTVRAQGGRIDAKQIVIYHHKPGESVPECDGRCRIPRQGERWPLPGDR
jgi:L-ascorbate metabolism protein UlaG (beta-lactamase superfamily)